MVEEILNLHYKALLAPKEVAEHLGVPEKEVRKVLYQHGTPYLKRNPVPNMTGTRMGEEIMRMAAGGLSTSEIADNLALPQSAVRKYLLGVGSITGIGGPEFMFSTEVRKEIAAKHALGGVSLVQLAEEYGCSDTTIRNCIIEFTNDQTTRGCAVCGKQDAPLIPLVINDKLLGALCPTCSLGVASFNYNYGLLMKAAQIVST